MANTFTTDLVTRELDGEDVAERAEAHNDLFLNLYRAHLTFYEGQYEFWHNPLVMNVKIGGNNILYWGVLGLLFFHRKLTDLDFMAAVRPGHRADLGDHPGARGDVPRVERARVARVARARWCPTAAFPAMFERHMDMVGGFDDETLKEKIASTAELMEAYAVLAFHRAAAALRDGAPDEDEKINPYAISLDPDRWEADGLFNGEGLSLAEARQTPAAGMENLLMENIAAGAEATASRWTRAVGDGRQLVPLPSSRGLPPRRRPAPLGMRGRRRRNRRNVSLGGSEAHRGDGVGRHPRHGRSFPRPARAR